MIDFAPEFITAENKHYPNNKIIRFQLSGSDKIYF